MELLFSDCLRVGSVRILLLHFSLVRFRGAAPCSRVELAPLSCASSVAFVSSIAGSLAPVYYFVPVGGSPSDGDT